MFLSGIQNHTFRTNTGPPIKTFGDDSMQVQIPAAMPTQEHEMKKPEQAGLFH